MKCANTYQTIRRLMQHLKNHDGSKFMCNVCKKTFVYQSNLDAHSKGHGVDKYWKCPSKTCMWQFKSISDYNCHMVSHEEKSFLVKNQIVDILGIYLISWQTTWLSTKV